ncbi:hypothetical protein C8J56DRAFT_1029386 [Mycena floridula]|nr:hypothetical protein C8J56DRAFT_1029386 [Mycena floridula]
MDSAIDLDVLEYTPTEGERGVPISVKIRFHRESTEAVFLRLVVASTAVATKVEALTDDIWKLDALAPSLSYGVHSEKVLLTVQVVNESDQVLTSLTFGEFTYWVPDQKPQSKKRPSSLKIEVPSGSHTSLSKSPIIRRHSLIASLPSPSSPSGRSGKPQRRLRANSLKRTKHTGSAFQDNSEELCPQSLILEIVTPLDSMCRGWDATELEAGRRLVKFNKIHDRTRLILSCESVSQDDYNEVDTVVSCIYRNENQGYYITSVDIIYLLEQLASDEFPVEEKNRIRRNLEGFRPMTVSKHKSGSENFFQLIMDFPDPKPRNIEKDLKVFDWSLLSQALDKILSKYSVFSSPTDSTESLPSEPDTATPQFSNVSLPQYTLEGESVYTDLKHDMTKHESMPDSLLFENHSYDTPSRLPLSLGYDLPQHSVNNPHLEVVDWHRAPSLGLGDLSNLNAYQLAELTSNDAGYPHSHYYSSSHDDLYSTGR